jgi:hypothetical protein
VGEFNPFKFLANRTISLPITEEEKNNFDLFITLRFMSMADGMENPLRTMNFQAFSKLPKKYQCMAFQALNGYKLTGTWKRFKAKPGKKSEKGLKAKVVELLKCSENEADAYINKGLMDTKVINDLYQRIYEPGTIKMRKKK